MSNSKSRKRRRQSELISSDSETEDDTSEVTRQSPRIMSRKKKPSFKLPTRDAVWSTIPSLKSTQKLSGLSPRKSVSNFTKIYNSYNYDDYEDSSEDDDENFEQCESDSSSKSSAEDSAKTPKRVKNYHRRIQFQSSSSEEEPVTKKTRNSDSFCSGVKAGESTGEPTLDIEENSEPPETENKGKTKDDDDDDVESEEEISLRRKRNSSLRQSLLASDDENEVNGTNDNDNVWDCVENNSNDDSDSEDSRGNRYGRAASLKNKKKELFSEFKDMLSKRKARSNN